MSLLNDIQSIRDQITKVLSSRDMAIYGPQEAFNRLALAREVVEQALSLVGNKKPSDSVSEAAKRGFES